jgi:phage terminase small subunit
MSPGARKIWDALVDEMASSGVLRTVDALALVQLCEDQAMLDTLRQGMAEMTREIAKKAKEKKLDLPGGPLIQLSRTIEGRRTLATIREISAQIILQRREFGLTPASNSRVQAGASGAIGFVDPLERALCG